MPIIFTPRVDGDYLPDLPANLMINKQYSDVNLLAGITKHEGALITRGKLYLIPVMWFQKKKLYSKQKI